MPREKKTTGSNSNHLGFEATLWATADKLRGNLDAAEYKHVVLGLIRSIEGNLGLEPADSFYRDLHKDLKVDYILANPPFNMSDWGGEPPARRRPLEIRRAARRQRQLRLGATFHSSPRAHGHGQLPPRQRQHVLRLRN